MDLKKLNNMRIRQRLSYGFTMVTVIACIASVIAGIAMFIIANRYSYALENYGFSQGDIGKAMVSLADSRSATRAVIGYTDPDIISGAIATHDEKKADFTEYMAVVEETLTSSEERELYEAVTSQMDAYWALDEQIINLGNTTDAELSAEAQDMAAHQLAPMYDEIYADLAALMDLNVKEGDSMGNMLGVLELVMIVLIVALIAAAALLAKKIGGTVAEGISKPVAALAERLDTFSKGDLGSDFPVVESKDEIADIVEAAKGMATELQLVINDLSAILVSMADSDYSVSTHAEESYIGDFEQLLIAVRKMNHQMNDTLYEIEEASNQVSIGSTNLADAAQALAEGATDQAGSVEELQATIATITENVEKTSERVDASYVQAKKYADEADSSREDMDKMVDAMKRINDTSQKIENIISEIEDIASQTNLLSLNAAIEAARAGEAGKGFAVVADQISKLADQSAQSARDTRELIEGSLKEIEEGNHAAESAAASIEEVVKGIKEIAATSKELSSIAKEQADAMAQAEIGVSQISEVVQSNSATAQESSATSQELSAQAVSMSELVGRFKLKSRDRY